MALSDLAVAVVDGGDLEQGKTLAERLSLPLLTDSQQIGSVLETASIAQLLLVDEFGVSLQQTGHKRPGAVTADFLGGAVNHRRQFGGGAGQLIAKACGIKGKCRPKIVDLTAGLGRDAFVLATLGCEVTMVERHPVVHALLQDGLAKAQNSEIGEIIARMTLVNDPQSAWAWLEQAPSDFDVLYCDPMFPHMGKQAAVKKEMKAFRTLVGADDDSALLLKAALSANPRRVVVKRPRKAPEIEGAAPSHQVVGKSSRYDVYALRRLSDSE